MRKSLLLLSLACTLSAAHSPAPPARPGGKDYALFFAVEQYDNSSAWGKLLGLIKEVEGIASDLRDLYAYSETKVLKNPSLAEIDAELAAWRARRFGPDDQVFIFFSGHGQYVDDRKQGYFIPRDGAGSVGSIYERKWLPYLDLKRLVTGIPCRHILLGLDACYSGTADDAIVFKDETEEWAEPENLQDKQWNQQIHDQLRCQSRILLTAGGKTKTENPSKFAASFRKAFSKQGGADKIVRPSDIQEEWFGLSIQPHASTFEGHEPCGSFLFVYQPKTSPTPPPSASPDYDDDGIPDKDDKCPAEKGTAAAKGCPDADGDGVADKFDDCKTQPGPASNNGCPVTKPVEKTPEKPAFADPMASSMVEVAGGKFKMGSTKLGSTERPVHDVTISTFWLSRYEVTVGQYLAFCTETDSHWPVWLEKGNLHHIETGTNTNYKVIGMSPSLTTLAVTGVSWHDAVAYCEWLTQMTGKNYRLPTEAEWEYAARGGQLSKNYKYAGSNNLAKVAWHHGNSGGKVHAVGGLQANELGLYDMSGNVSEWCADRHDNDYYKNSPGRDPKGPESGNFRVYRGGSCLSPANFCRIADRSSIGSAGCMTGLGFRVAQDSH